jgi:hypothetical protein
MESTGDKAGNKGIISAVRIAMHTLECFHKAV